MASSARIDELKQKFDENPRRYFAPLANEYRKAGDLEQAIQLCRAYLPQNAGHMSGHIVFGQALFESGQYDEARTVFETALSLDPENLIALRHLGDIAHHAGDLAAARQWYQRVLDADPRNEDMAGVLAALDASAPAATPAGAGPSSGGMGSWGDINPERAGDAGTAPPNGGRPSGGGPELRDSLSTSRIEVVTPEFERDGEGAFAPPSADAAHRAPPELERSEEIDLRSARPADPSPLGDMSHIAGDAAAASADAMAASAPRPTHLDQSFGSSNEMGFEVMEFVPPARDSDVPPTPGRTEATYSGPFTGETAATDETPAAFVTETMAELYLQQGFTQEALNVYRQLLAQNPRDQGLRDRVAALEAGSRSSVGAADVSARVLEQAERRQLREPETVRAFFAGLMRRRVLQRYDEDEGHLAPESGPEGDGSSHGMEVAAGEWAASEAAQAVAEERPTDDWSGSSGTSSATDDAFIVPEGAAAPPGVLHAEEIHARDAYRSPGQAAPEEEPATAQPPAPGEDVHAPSQVEAGTAAPPHGGTIDRLFGQDVPHSDEHAARVLSGAFPVVEATAISGRPAERATTELSLDHVFREADRKSGRASGGFSFDQFFSGGGGDGTPPAPRPSDPGKVVGGPELPPDDDVEQFNDWLTGLKKK